MGIRVVRRLVVLALVVAAIALSTSYPRAQQPSSPAAADEVLVQFRSGVSPQARAAVRSAHAATVIRRYDRLRIERLRIPGTANAAAEVRALMAHPESGSGSAEFPPHGSGECAA